MTTPKLDGSRWAAIRSGLAAVPRPPRRFRLWQGLFAFGAAGLLAGGAVSAAAVTASYAPPTLDAAGGQTSEGSDGIPAPPGTPPGYPVISMLGGLTSATTSGDAHLSLEPPIGATHVRVSIVCLTAGTLYWGTDPGGNNPSIECSEADLSAPSNTSYDFPAARDLYVSAEQGVASLVSYQFIEKVPTAWGINARGETYGVPKDGAGEPDLMLVVGTDPAGNPVEGYARSSELAGELPTNPDDAAEYDSDRRAVPVYESDGVTQIGVFYVG